MRKDFYFLNKYRFLGTAFLTVMAFQPCYINATLLRWTRSGFWIIEKRQGGSHLVLQNPQTRMRTIFKEVLFLGFLSFIAIRVHAETPEAYNERMSKGTLQALVADTKVGLRLPHNPTEVSSLKKAASEGGHLACAKWLYPKRPEFWTIPKQDVRGDEAIDECISTAREGAKLKSDEIALKYLGDK